MPPVPTQLQIEPKNTRYQVWVPLLVISCLGAMATGFGGKSASKSVAASPGAETSSPQAGSADTVWVTRSDGGRQCETGSGDSLESGQVTLEQAHVRVLESSKQGDGKMHIALCGAESGKQNSYRIQKSDLPQALSLGFKPATLGNEKKK